MDVEPRADLRPIPVDDGGAAHLRGLSIPAIGLPSTLGGSFELAQPTDSRLVIYVYPMTGVPGEPLPADWDLIPGARGCTPQSCAFREHSGMLAANGAAIVGLSAQSPEQQLEFAEREHIPYPLLSDSSLQLATELSLPTFKAAGMRLYKRLTMIVSDGRIEKVFYPVFPPEANASEVLSWLAANPRA